MKHKKTAYVIITHYYNPINTPGPNKGKVSVKETVEFTDRIKNKQMDSASAILDIFNEKMVKNRSVETPFATYLEYLEGKYTDEMNKLYTLLGIQKVVEIKEPTVAEEESLGELMPTETNILESK